MRDYLLAVERRRQHRRRLLLEALIFSILMLFLASLIVHYRAENRQAEPPRLEMVAAAPKPVPLTAPDMRAELRPAHDVIITAYTSRPEETDDTPFLTATMTQTRPGVVAVSRDLLQGALPYTTRVLVFPAGGDGCDAWNSGADKLLPTVFVVEDTMHRRKTNQVDVWMPSLDAALTWGYCYGHVVALDGPRSESLP